MNAVNLYRNWVNINGLLFFLAVVVLSAFQPVLSQTNKKASLTAEREKIEGQLLTTSRLIDEAKNALAPWQGAGEYLSLIHI